MTIHLDKSAPCKTDRHEQCALPNCVCDCHKRKLKRYLVFSGADYYPGGGWSDFDGSFDTIEEARDHKSGAELRGYRPEWKQIIDSETGQEVE